MTRSQQEWNERYAHGGELPWDTGRPDKHLAELVTTYPIAPGKALEIGGGTGTNATWLAGQGFAVTMTDIAATAIERARQRAEAARCTLDLRVSDVLKEPLPGGPYDFIFDRGCFHSFERPDEQLCFAKRVAAALRADGLWFSLIGSTDGPPREVGPPRRSAVDIATVVEPHFEILRMIATEFDSRHPVPPRAWTCLFRKRG